MSEEIARVDIPYGLVPNPFGSRFPLGAIVWADVLKKNCFGVYYFFSLADLDNVPEKAKTRIWSILSWDSYGLTPLILGEVYGLDYMQRFTCTNFEGISIREQDNVALQKVYYGMEMKKRFDGEVLPLPETLLMQGFWTNEDHFNRIILPEVLKLAGDYAGMNPKDWNYEVHPDTAKY